MYYYLEQEITPGKAVSRICFCLNAPSLHPAFTYTATGVAAPGRFHVLSLKRHLDTHLLPSDDQGLLS